MCFGERTPSAAAKPNGRIAMIALRRCVNPPMPGGMNVRSEHLKNSLTCRRIISVPDPPMVHHMKNIKWIFFAKTGFLPGFLPLLALWHGDKKITKRGYVQDFGGARTQVIEVLTQQARKNRITNRRMRNFFRVQAARRMKSSHSPFCFSK